MWSIPFFVFSLVFAWMVYQAMSTRKVMGRGWGNAIRYYSRDDEPVRFWVLTVTYIVIVVGALVFGVMALGRLR